MGNKVKKEKKSVSKQVSYIAVIFFLGIFVLLMGSEGYENITASKHVYFVVATITLVLFIIADMICNPVINDGLKDRIKKLTIDKYLLIAYLLWSIISCIFSKYDFIDTFYGQSRYEGLFSLILYISLYMVCSRFGKCDNLILTIIAITSFIYGGIGLLQCFGSKILYPEGAYYYGTNFISTTGHRDLYSGVISMFVPILFLSYVFSEDKKRFIYLPGLFILFLSQLLTKVDSGKIGMLVAMFIALPFIFDEYKHASRGLEASGLLLISYAIFSIYRWSKSKGNLFTVNKKFYIILALAILIMVVGIIMEIYTNKKKLVINNEKIKRNRWIIVAVLCVFLVISLVYVFNYKGEIKLISEASSLLHGRLSDEMGTYRGYIWKNCFKIIAEHPITGIGTGVFLEEFRPYNAEYMSYMGNIIVDFAHNDFIEIAVCQGIVGLVIYLSFLGAVLIRAFKHCNKTLVVILLCGVIGYLAYVSFVFSIAIVTPLFWVLLGLLRYETENE